MKKERVKLSVVLLLSAGLGFAFMQFLYLSSSYKLAAKEFDFLAGNLVADVFYKTPMNYEGLREYSRQLLEISGENKPLPGPKKVENRLKKILEVYGDTGAVLKNRFKMDNMEMDFKYAITVGVFELTEPGGKRVQLIRGSPTGREPVLFGNLGHPGGSLDKKWNAGAFYKTGPNYYIQVDIYVNYYNRFTYLLGKIRSTILAALISALLGGGVIFFIIKTMLGQKKLSDMKTDFIDNLTHEINTPISTIDVAAQGLIRHGDRMDGEKLKETGQLIERQSRRLGELTSNVMKLSFMDKNSAAWNFEPTELSALITPLAEDFKVRHSEKELELSLHLDPDLPSLQLDQSSISTALLNILENAVRYCESKPEISISTFNMNGSPVISIADNGIGMSREEQKKIFQKFYRVPRGNVHTVKGLGLGLYNTSKIIEAHGGHIRVKSKTGGGSVFEITFPGNLL